MVQHCSTESRAFFVIDNLTAGCWVWTKKALLRLGSTLAVALKQPCPVGVAVLHRSKPGQAAQLQVLMRMGSRFHAREFVTCIQRLPTTASADATAADGNMINSALVALIGHMQKLPARPDCINHMFVLSSSFTPCASNQKMQKMLQLLVEEPSFAIHFLQLTGPESELQAASEPDGAAQQPQAQPQPASDTSFQQVLRSFSSSANITYDAFVADCEAVSELMCQSWLRELLTPAAATSRNSSNGGCQPPHTPDLLLHFGSQTLPCSLQQHILQLDPWLLPAHLCPCHQLPMQPSTSTSSVSACHTAAAAAASDAGSMAALLMLPEAAPWSCCLTGQPVNVPLSSCSTDARILQLGRHTQLTTPLTAPAAAPTATAGQDTEQILHKQLRVLQALPMGSGEPCEVTARHAVSLTAIDSMTIYGMPLLLVPTASSSFGTSATAAPAAATTPHGLGPGGECLMQQQQQEVLGMSSTEAGMLMRALCQLLLEQQQVLVVSSNHDLLRRVQLPLQQWYLLQPGTDGSSLLLRCLASREQLLPPKHRSSSGLGSSSAAESVEDQVVLLDAEQLESVRTSLAGLRGSGTSSSLPVSGGDQPGLGVGSGEEQGLVAMVMGGVQEAAGSDAEGQQQPLLLSCGLDAWVSAVLESSAGTYTPPPAAPMVLPGTAAAAGAGRAVRNAEGAAGAAPSYTGGTRLPQHAPQQPPLHSHINPHHHHQQQQQMFPAHNVQHGQQQQQQQHMMSGDGMGAGQAPAAMMPAAGEACGLTGGAAGPSSRPTAAAKGGRGRRNSSTASAAAAGSNRKLRLSKV